jgi:hypothetical protein
MSGDGPAMLGLGGGQVLIRGAAVVEVSRALDWAIRIQERRDGVHASQPLRALQQLSRRPPSRYPLALRPGPGRRCRSRERNHP